MDKEKTRNLNQISDDELDEVTGGANEVRGLNIESGRDLLGNEKFVSIKASQSSVSGAISSLFGND